MSTEDDENRSSGSKYTKAGDGRLFRGNFRDKGSTAGKHVGDRSKPPATGGSKEYQPQHGDGQ